ncbi:Vesicle transport protein, Use [Trema orientale]|uniref:Vesicle transport protein, Use n=1 Tax=Trema orientale TaxID=63057 RepID=A0A2P5CVZ7_TREOI|nr:Vesicle transport protein, Use [Trema orientale]
MPTSNFEDKAYEINDANSSAPVKLDAVAQAHIEKHIKLQEDLTDEMVGMARQLKESSLLVSQSLQNSEKIGPKLLEVGEGSLHRHLIAIPISSPPVPTT